VPVPLDEFPIHQAPLSMAQVATSDRNSYDRCYFNVQDRTGDLFMITGLGVYPNLGVTDAYATVAFRDRQVSVRMSDALGDDRMQQQVGPYRIEVLEPLRRIRLVCETDDLGIGFDLMWEGSVPTVWEPRHQMMSGPRILLDALRFCQLGTWAGSLRVDGTEYDVTADRWVGARDRSWGIRPVGEQPGPGRPVEPRLGSHTHWWLYSPLRFDDFAVVVIAQEEGDGHRTMFDAQRIWGDGKREQLGWPEFDIRYRSGTRHPEHVTIHVTDRNRKPMEIEIDTLGFVALGLGSGYGGDAWTHGTWMEPGWVDRVDHDMTDPAIAGRLGFGMLDHVARATFDGAEGYGLFEHASVGRHDPSGFADLGSVAP
jgi:hypothetical protein